jgi:HNH endonuclease
MSTRIPESLRTQIDATDRGSYCYCLTSEAVSGIPLTYDHVTPTSRGGLTTFDNVCLACRTCNEFKTNTTRAVDPLTQESTPLFHPRQQHWPDHFAWSLDGTRIEGTTAIGRATVGGVANEPRAHRGRPASLVRRRLAPTCGGAAAQAMIRMVGTTSLLSKGLAKHFLE